MSACSRIVNVAAIPIILKNPMITMIYRLSRSCLPTLMLGVLTFVSCGGGADDTSRDYQHHVKCDLTPQTNAQKAFKRENYYPEKFSSDFSRNYGADISPMEADYDIAEKVSRSVFEIEFFRKNSTHSFKAGTGWLIAPRYVVTAAHNLHSEESEGRIHVHTFDGETIEAERVYIDPGGDDATDLAVLRLEREIDAVPMKIADERPERNEFLMAMGLGSMLRELGAWTVSAGPALELQSGKSDPRLPGRIYHAVPTASGMSGGPIFDRDGEVVSIVSRGDRVGRGFVEGLFGIRFSEVPRSPPNNLWVYGFIQPDPGLYSSGPNPKELRDLYDKVRGLEEPEDAGKYRDGNTWRRADHEFGDQYSPFPLDRFEHMQNIYKEARKSAVRIIEPNNGSGFIYDSSTVITAGHVAPEKGSRVSVLTEKNDRAHAGTVIKTQDRSGSGRCDIAIIEMDRPGDLSEYKGLAIGDSSSLRCGDPVVAIGSAYLYDSVGPLQGVGAVYKRTKKYTSEFISRSTAAGMSGGPIVNSKGEVVSLSSTGLGKAEDKWPEPGPLIIRTRLPVYFKQDFFEGPNAETIRRFVEDEEFDCE